MQTTKVKGYCPVCGHPDPEVGADAFLHCTNPECPQPDLVGELLLDNETEHIVQIRVDGSWIVKHPLRERIGCDLFNCTIAGHSIVDIVADRMKALPLPVGMHRLVEDRDFDPELLDNPEYGGGPWGWEHLDAKV